MLKKTIYLSRACSVSLKNCQMEIVDKDTGEEKIVPIEDIGIVIVENQRTTLTIPVLNALSDNNSTVIMCDRAMRPNSILLPLEGNNVQAEVLKLQIAATEPLKKQLWKQIITAKIKNQSAALMLFGKDGNVLKPYYCNVKSGDSDNREGIAARLYWTYAFFDGFSRAQESTDVVNSMLNYGYSLLRAAMSRAIVGSGLSLSFGLFHKNKYNAFPLADDLMEPYRPYVDCAVYDLWKNGVEEFNKDAKAALLRVLSCDVQMKGVVRPLEIGLSFTTASLVKCLSGEVKELNLPTM